MMELDGDDVAVAPPEDMIDLAVRTARLSPCAKSKRGVVVFGHDKESDSGVDAIANGFNGQPLPFKCDGTIDCKETCGKRCVHAEDRAIRQACIVHVVNSRRRPSVPSFILESLGDLREYEAVHVKIDADGNLIWGGGPSCWQCSRTVMDVNLGAFWLYEREFTELKCPYSDVKLGGKACLHCAREACMTHPELARLWLKHALAYRVAEVEAGRFDSDRLEKSLLRFATEADEAVCGCDAAGRHVGLPPVSTVWRRYTAEEFHRATLGACDMLNLSASQVGG